MQWPNEKGQNDKQWFTKYYTELNIENTEHNLKLGVHSGAPEGWDILNFQPNLLDMQDISKSVVKFIFSHLLSFT